MPLFKAFPREDKPDISIYGDGTILINQLSYYTQPGDVHTNAFLFVFKLCMTIKSTGDLSQRELWMKWNML